MVIPGGMATADVIKTIDEIQQNNYKDCTLLIGIDGNTYYENVSDGKKNIQSMILMI